MQDQEEIVLGHLGYTRAKTDFLEAVALRQTSALEHLDLIIQGKQFSLLEMEFEKSQQKGIM